MAGKTSMVNHRSFLALGNFIFLKISVFVCVLATVGYFATDFTPVRNGGTWYGYTLGTVGALLIIWLTLLGLRKRWISQGNWSLKAWTSAHVYLGLSLTIIATLHTGFQFGLNVHTLAYALMMGVIISGLFGIYYYATIPKLMSDNQGQMEQAAMLDEVASLDRLLRDTAQPLDDHYVDMVRYAINNTRLGGNIFKRMSGRPRKCATRDTLQFFREDLRDCSAEMRTPILDVLSVLERKNALLVRIRTHAKYKARLGVWLYFHIPMTFALWAALIAHIVSVFYYS